ncbi:hypothetical protein L226DRAFT_385950 [Lentinus tigrinus ALCF2SS1-7]|uniref:uncharacterized protein n=1 Tax=Lentinus tigrinus ALCF2SS1-7 TaxID=1328758 RepID=UPI001165FEAD|nr:hypothetical protein L226DRAFT_385950 [Lentinus tigrinus ALCF2SS1-7]
MSSLSQRQLSTSKRSLPMYYTSSNVAVLRALPSHLRGGKSSKSRLGRRGPPKHSSSPLGLYSFSAEASSDQRSHSPHPSPDLVEPRSSKLRICVSVVQSASSQSILVLFSHVQLVLFWKTR